MREVCDKFSAQLMYGYARKDDCQQSIVNCYLLSKNRVNNSLRPWREEISLVEEWILLDSNSSRVKIHFSTSGISSGLLDIHSKRSNHSPGSDLVTNRVKIHSIFFYESIILKQATYIMHRRPWPQLLERTRLRTWTMPMMPHVMTYMWMSGKGSRPPKTPAASRPAMSDPPFTVITNDAVDASIPSHVMKFTCQATIAGSYNLCTSNPIPGGPQITGTVDF